ncbi:unnamed protein product [Cladocopium goreaui]|uniref:Sodium/potassium/calcium exchanger 2 n=1 Tax=Cladocopium goreaui TaxID=2562237 RepID=A0A9P1G492_9DINO|nr:unnamed protein product [Cladocopium goreaui]
MVSSEEWRFTKHAWIATLFAVVTGYADVVSLVRYQAFASILTGNAIWLGRVAVDPKSDDQHTGWYYVAICASFSLGSVLHRICELRWPNRGGSIAAIPLALLMSLTEIVYMATECSFHESYLRWTVVLVAPLFGIVAAACSNGRMGTHTTMVTGHILTLTQIVGNLVMARLGYDPMKLNVDKRKSMMSIMVIAGTIAGACLGSYALVIVEVHHVLLFPVPLLIYALLWLHDHLAKPRSLIKRVQKKWRERQHSEVSEDISVTSQDAAPSVESSDDEDEVHRLRRLGHESLKRSDCYQAAHYFQLSREQLQKMEANVTEVLGLQVSLSQDHAFALICSRRFQDGIALLEGCLTSPLKCDSKLLNALGYAFCQMEDLETAAKVFQMGLSEDPENPIIWNNLGAARMPSSMFMVICRSLPVRFWARGCLIQSADFGALGPDVTRGTMEPSMVVGCLWFIVIAFMFFAQHHVCDAYFVPAINVFVGKMKKSSNTWLQRWGDEAVAGATICALGCNGPEMFTNLISLYTGSDAGIGVVVGSEIFNLLIIVGLTISAAPVVPLALERVPFARDCFFYALSIALLYWALLDHAIESFEAWVLLGAALVYVCCVYFTGDLIIAIPALRPTTVALEEPASPSKKKGKMHGIEVSVEEILHARMADAHKDQQQWNVDPTAHGIYAEPQQIPAEQKESKGARQSIGFQFDVKDSMLGAVLKYKDLQEVVLMEMGVMNLEFYHNLQHITLRLTVEDPDQRDQLLNNIKEYSLGRPWVHGYDATIVGAWQHLRHTLGATEMPLIQKLVAVPEFLIDSVLRLTLFPVDVKDITKESRWPLCFAGAMFWLAIFSFFMLEIANQIHYNIPALPNSFLGITVCAIGTSFPNAVASVLMAQQNNPAAAIANALGSNVQNVFLAMALPWVIYQLQHGGKPINQNVAGINEGVLWMCGTLILVIFFVLLPPFCKLSYAYGPILVSVYVAYLVVTSGETFGWWPPLVK